MYLEKQLKECSEYNTKVKSDIIYIYIKGIWQTLLSKATVNSHSPQWWWWRSWRWSWGPRSCWRRGWPPCKRGRKRGSCSSFMFHINSILRQKDAGRKIGLHKVNADLNAQLTFLRLGGLAQGREDTYLPQSKASPLERRKGKRSVHHPLLWCYSSRNCGHKLWIIIQSAYRGFLWLINFRTWW